MGRSRVGVFLALVLVASVLVQAGGGSRSIGSARAQADPVAPTTGPSGLSVTLTDDPQVRRVNWDLWDNVADGSAPDHWVLDWGTEEKVVGGGTVGTTIAVADDEAVIEVTVKGRNGEADGPTESFVSDPAEAPPGEQPEDIYVSPTGDDGQISVQWTNLESPLPVEVRWATGTMTIEPEDPRPFRISGLENGAVQRVTARAIGPYGLGPTTVARSMSAGAPTRGPEGVTAEATGSGQVEVHWDELPGPDQGLGSTFVGYRIEGPDGSQDVGPEATSAVIDNLEGGQSKAFSVAGVTDFGAGVRTFTDDVEVHSAPIASPPGAEAHPTGVNGEIELTWSALSDDDDGGLTVSGFAAVVDGVTTTAGSSDRSLTLTGQPDGVARTIYLSALNADGSGDAVELIATAEGPPTSAPVGIEAAPTASSGELAVTWDPVDAADGGGSVITGYLIHGGIEDVTVPAGDNQVTLTGIPDGDATALTVAAVNAHGAGPASGPVTATPGTPLAAPGGVRATTASATSIRVRWNPLGTGDTGASPLTGYVVSWNGGELVADDEDTQIVVPDLIEGTAYSFRVRARNDNGDGPRSAPTPDVPMGAPTAAPTSITAEATGASGTVHLQWDALDPEDEGSSALTGFIVQTDQGDEHLVAPEELGSDIIDLYDGAPRTFRIAATNSVGRGPWSEATQPVVPHGPPTAEPPNAEAHGTGVSGEVQLSWDELTEDGGENVTGYRVVWSTGSVTLGPEARSYTVADLEDGDQVDLGVSGFNTAGDGPAAGLHATPGEAPTIAPADVIVNPTGTSDELLVTWSALTTEEQGTGPLTGYEVLISGQSAQVASADVTNLLLSGLTAGQSYEIGVRATSPYGDGPTSSPTTGSPAGHPTAAPTGVTAIPTGVPGQVKVQWSKISDTSWAGLQGGYTIRWAEFSQYVEVGRGAVVPVTVSGLSTVAPTTFTVTATNAYGDGPESPPSRPVQPSGRALLPNLLPDADFEVAVDGWIGSHATVRRSPEVGHDGVVSLEVTAGHSVGDEPPAVSTAPSDVAIAAGDTYRADAYVGTTQDAATVAPLLVWWDDNGAAIGSPTMGDQTIEGFNEWSHIQIEGTAPEGATHVSVVVAYLDALPGSRHWVDTISLVRVDDEPTPNLLTPSQSNLETGTGAWTSLQTTISRSFEGGGHDSGSALRITIETPNDQAGNPALVAIPPMTNGMEVTPGDPLSTRAWLRATEADRQAQLVFYFFNDSGQFVDGQVPDPVPLQQGDWTEVEAQVEVPTGATRAAVAVLATGDVGTVTYLDDVSIWHGTLGDEASANILGASDSGFETDAIGWLSAQAEIGTSPDRTRSGLLALRVRDAAADAGPNMMGVITDMGTSGVPVRGNRRYTASLWVRPESIPRTVRPAIGWFTEDGTLISTDGLPVMGDSIEELADDWLQLSLTDIAPPNARYAAIGLAFTDAETGDIHYLDEARFCEGNSPDCIGEQPPAARPTNSTATGTAVTGELRVTWSPLGSDDHERDAVTGYRISWDGGNQVIDGPDADEVVLTDLTPTTTYRFQVRAMNEWGDGPPSTESDGARPQSAPVDAPTVAVSVPGTSGDLGISWQPPADSGGLPITGYTVRWTGGSEIVDGDARELSIHDLENGVPVGVTVSASNSIGEGPESAQQTKTPGIRPGAVPGGIAAEDTGTSHAVHVSWSALTGEDIGTGPLDGYMVRWGEGEDDVTLVSGGALETTIDGLTNGTSYSFKVSAVSQYGEGPRSTHIDVTPTGPPSQAPTGVTARSTGESGRVVVEWNPYAWAGFEGKVGDLEIAWGDQGTMISAAAAKSGRTTVTGLPDSEGFTFTIRAVNGNGNGPWSLPSRSVTASGRATYPNLLTSNQSDLEDAGDGWVGWNSDLSHTSLVQHDGLISLQVQRAPNLTGPIAATVGTGSDELPVVAGDDYIGSAWVGSTVTRDVRARIEWLDVDGLSLGTVDGDVVGETPAEWSEVEVRGSAPSNAVRALLSVVIDAPGDAEPHFVDSVAFVADLPGAPNLLEGASSTFEVAGSDWIGRNIELGRTTGTSHTGHTAMHMIGNEPIWPGDNQVAAITAPLGTPIGIDEGFELNAYLSSDEATGAGAMIVFLDDDGNVLNVPSPDILNIAAGEWTLVHATATAPQGATRVAAVVMSELPAGQSLAIDDVSLRSAADPDGSNLLGEEDSGFETSVLGWASQHDIAGLAAERARHGGVAVRLAEGETYTFTDGAESGATTFHVLTTDQGVHGAPVLPGRTYTGAAWVSPQDGVSGARAATHIIWFDATGAVIPPDESFEPVIVDEIPGDWTQVVETQVAPPGAAFASLGVGFAGPVGSVQYVDDAVLCQGASPDCVAEQAPTSRPTGAVAEPTNQPDELHISWDPYDIDQIERGNVDGFRISWAGGSVDVPGGSAHTGFIEGLDPGQPVAVSVAAFNTAGTGPKSSQTQAVIPGSPTGAVESLEGDGTIGGDITLRWDALASDAGGSTPVESVEIAWDGGTRSVDAADHEVTIGGFDPAAEVDFIVLLANGHGPSPHLRTTHVSVPGTTIQMSDLHDGDLIWGDERVQVAVPRPVGIDRVELLVDDEVIGNDQTSPYAVDFDTAGLDAGSHEVMARAVFEHGEHLDSSAASVTLSNDPGPTSDRLSADVARGRISKDQYVTYGLKSLWESEDVPDRYREGAPPPPLERTGELLTYLSRFEGELEPATQDWVNYVSTTGAFPESSQGGALSTDAELPDPYCPTIGDFGGGGFIYLGQTVIPRTWGGIRLKWCVVSVSAGNSFPLIDIWYYPGEGAGKVDPLDENSDGIPDHVANTARTFADAANFYRDTLYLEPPDDDHLDVVMTLVPGGFASPGPQDHFILLPDDAGTEYLPSHELFHYFQYNYESWTDVYPGGLPGNWSGRQTTLWWNEAAADWAVHQMVRAGYVTGSSYADDIYAFLKSPEERLVRTPGFPRYPQAYGAFIMNEYLQSTREGPDSASFVKRILLGLNEGGGDQRGALEVMEDELEVSGITMSTFLMDFWRAAYLLASDQDAGPTLGFSIEDQEEDLDLWRGVLEEPDNNVTNGESVFSGEGRASRTVISLEPHSPQTIEGSIKFGGAAFYDVELPEDARGTLTYNFNVSGSRHEKLGFGLMSYDKEFPRLCRVSDVNAEGGEVRMALPAQGIGGEEGGSVSEGYVRGSADAMGGLSLADSDGFGHVTLSIDETCNKATLVIVHLDPDSSHFYGDDDYTGTLVFQQSIGAPALINNETVELGVNPTGTLIFGDVPDGEKPDLENGVGLRYIAGEDQYEGEGLAMGRKAQGWGVATSDGLHGGTTEDQYRSTSPNLKVVAFTSTDSTASSTVDLTSPSDPDVSELRIKNIYEPAVDSAGVEIPELYELKVSVTNRGIGSRNITYRHTADWDVQPHMYEENITLGGGAPWLLGASNDGFASPDPTDPLCSMDAYCRGLGTTDSGPRDQGTAFDIDLGSVAPGATITFSVFLGAATNETDALTALYRSGSQVYGVAEEKEDPDGGSPYTFVVGIKR